MLIDSFVEQSANCTIERMIGFAQSLNCTEVMATRQGDFLARVARRAPSRNVLGLLGQELARLFTANRKNKWSDRCLWNCGLRA